MAIYKYKRSNGMGVPAQVAGETCERLEGEGRLTPHDLVEEGRPEDSPMHPAFEWDDAVAGELYREVQASKIIRMLVTVPKGTSDPEPVRAFVSQVKETDDGAQYRYKGICHVLRDVDDRDALLRSALMELNAFQRKYARLKELSGVFAAIEGVRQLSIGEDVA